MPDILSYLDAVSPYWPGIILLGFIIGMLSGLTGTGGGFLMTPMLRILFGIPYNIAVGSDLCAILFTSISGTIRHFKYRHVNMKLGLILLSGSIVGVGLGAKLLTFFRDSGNLLVFGRSVPAMDLVMNCSYITLLFSVSVMMFREAGKYPGKNDGCPPAIRDLTTYKISFFLFPVNRLACPDLEKNTDSLNAPALLITGFSVGFLSGFLGVGGGFIMTPVLICVFRLPAVVAIGTDLFQIAFTSFFGSASHLMLGNINFILVGLILCGSIAGSQVGASLTAKFRGRKIRLYFAYLLLLSAIFITAELIYSYFNA